MNCGIQQKFAVALRQLLRHNCRAGCLHLQALIIETNLSGIHQRRPQSLAAEIVEKMLGEVRRQFFCFYVV